MPSSRPAARESCPRRRGRAAFAAALLLLALAACSPVTYTDLVDREPLLHTTVDMSAAGSPALATIYNLGMEHYRTGNWPAAIDQLARAERMLRADAQAGPPQQPLFLPFVRLYLGVARFQGGKVAEALADFDALADPSVVLPLRERGLWYGAQCRLLKGDAEGALRQLAELGGSPVYAQQSRDLVERVRARRGS